MARKAVILLSGGVDSTTTLAIAKNQGFEPYAISFRYGQRHAVELQAAQRVAKAFGVARHIIIDVNLSAIGGSALTDEIAVPKKGSAAEIKPEIPVTYVPARNSIFLSIALGFAEVVGAEDIFIGANAVDYSGYPDCRPEFIRAFEKMANLATKAGVEGKSEVKIHTPLISLTKAEIIKKGIELGVDYSLTHSCYDPDGEGNPCGHCDSCLFRLKGFQEANLSDPLKYNK